jgi:hypothetical protein
LAKIVNVPPLCPAGELLLLDGDPPELPPQPASTSAATAAAALADHRVALRPGILRRFDRPDRRLSTMRAGKIFMSASLP